MGRLPYEQYIRFLITKKVSLAEINEQLHEMRLPPILAAYYENQAYILESSKLPVAVKDYLKTQKKKPKGFLDYMASISLKEAWEDSPLFKKSLDLFSDANIRSFLNAHIRLNCVFEELDINARQRFGIQLNPELITLYKQYFFNPVIMTRKAWNQHIATLQGREKEALFMTFSAEREACFSFLGLKVKVSVSDHYLQLHMMALERVRMLSSSKTPATDAQILKWANLVLATGDKYEKLKTADIMDFSQELQLSFEHVDTDFPMIGDIVQEAKKVE